uniref:WAP domain-containing protein n=1 Tax=Leptobrachium leishanense TaxID=445787 RepID=A0A8C5RA49_9ANUR
MAEKNPADTMAGPRNIFCLLFLIVICAGEWSNDKPGVCPPARSATCPPNTNCEDWCDTDADCLTDKKCCPESGGKVCKPPKGVRPGDCPDFSRRKSRCDDKCTSDSECAPDYKCCMSEDGFLTCMPPVGVPEGFCPGPRFTPPHLSGGPLCIKCPRGQKCCYNRCMRTVREKPGSCPMNAIHCIQKSFNLCSGDGGCPGKEKCCGYRCGKTCLSNTRRLADSTE